jgi:hypothetical protein
MKSGFLNLLELSGPVQACNGIDFTFTVPVRFSLLEHGKLDLFGGSENLTSGNINGLAT